jgi:hypothetical protein
MAKPHTRPGVLWKLLGTALALEVQDDAAEAAEVEGSMEGSSSSLSEGEWSESRVAAAASSLLRWERPELLFAYLGKRVLTDLLCMHRIATDRHRWLLFLYLRSHAQGECRAVRVGLSGPLLRGGVGGRAPGPALAGCASRLGARVDACITMPRARECSSL